MTRTVFCRKYQQEMDGLDLPPMPGAKGQDILNNVSRQAWQEWMAHQTMLINEKRLSLMNPDDRQYLDQQRELFFDGGEIDEAEGYVPPSSS